MSEPSADAGEVRRLFDQVCDLAPSARRAVFEAQGTRVSVVAEVEELLACDSTVPSGPRVPLAHMLAALPETEVDAGGRLGAWRLVRRLAKGGMGAVFLAERADGHFEQQAAIKLIRGMPGAETLLDFARERQMLASLQHPHIARLLDGGATPGGQPYLVMEYVEGEPIDAYCERHALSLDARLKLFQEVCRAVQFAHQHLIVHCDLKPSNVLVRDDGTPVLLDFGIARVIDRQRTTDALAAASGGSGYYTPGYASPEQMSGEAVTTASDVYALGLILFELVTGRKARIDTGDQTVALLGEALLQPSQVAGGVAWRRGIAGDIDAIVLRATAAQPRERYTAANMLADDIQRHLGSRPVSARPPSPIYRASRLLRRRWPVFAAAAIAGVLILAFTWRLAMERDRARGAEREAQVQAATSERVSDFLTSVFNVSNPRSGHRRDISARDVLDEGAARIEHELVDEPRVKAKLTDTLATAYRFIGEPARSIDLFRSAIDLYLDPRVGDPLGAARALSQLAVGYANNTYPLEQAEAAARRSLDLRQQHGADALELADAWNSLGIVLHEEDKFDDADAALHEGLRLRRENGADASTVATSLHNLGLVANSRGEKDASIRLFEEALALRRSAVGEHHRDYQSTLVNYGVSLGRAGKAAQALPVLEQNLKLANELYGDVSIHTGNAHNELGSVLQDLGRFHDAVGHYETAVRIGEGISDGSANLALPLNNLASVLEDMGDVASAIPLLRRSLQIRVDHLPATDARVARARYNLGRALVKTGSVDEARPLLVDALAQFLSRRGEADPATFKAHLWLAELELKSGNVAEAAEGLAQLEHSGAPLTPLLRSQRATFASELASTLHDDASSLDRREEAWSAMRDSFGEQHPLVAANAVAYADALDSSGRHAEAQALAQSALPVIDAELARDAPAMRMIERWRNRPSQGR